MKNLNISEFLLDTLTIYSASELTLVNGGYQQGSASVKHADWPCSLQPIMGGATKSEEYANLDVQIGHKAISTTVLNDLTVGDYAVDGDGTEYEITGWNKSGGNNPVGDVFTITLNKRKGT